MNLKFYNHDDLSNSHLEVRKNENGLFLQIEDPDGTEGYNSEFLTISSEDALELGAYILGEKSVMQKQPFISSEKKRIRLKNRNGEYTTPAFFHQWANHFIADSGFVGTITVAIVETESGRIQKLDPEEFRFMSEKEMIFDEL